MTNPDGWQRNPDNTWSPPLRAVQHPPNAQLEVPPNVQQSVIRDGAVLVRDAEDDLVIRMGKLSDGSYGLELIEGGLTINQLSGTTLVVKDNDGDTRVIVGEDDGDFDVKIFEDGGINPVKLSTLAFGLDAGVVNTSQSTSSANFTDLATVGPTATVTIGPSGRALVLYGAAVTITGNNPVGEGEMAFAISGATTRAASANDVASFLVNLNDADNPSFTNGGSVARASVATGLTEGANTFTLQYREPGGFTAFFKRRWIAVQPF